MTYQSEVLADSPLAYWKLDDLTDASGNGRTLVQTGAVTFTQPGLITDGGNSAEFPGADGNRLDATYDAALDNYKSYTLEAWVNLDSTYWQHLIDRDGAARVFQFRVYQSRFEFIPFSTRGTPFIGTSNAVLSTGQTYHLVATHDQATNTAALYINGVLDKTFGTSGTQATGSVNTALGVYVGGYYGPLDGRMDAVAIYPSALSAARIAAHYTAGTAAGGGPINMTADPVAVTVDPGTATVSGLTGGPINMTADPVAVTIDPGTATADIVRYVRMSADPTTVRADAFGHAVLRVPVAASPAGVLNPLTSQFVVNPDPVLMAAVQAMTYGGTPQPVNAVVAVRPIMPDPATMLTALGRPNPSTFVPTSVTSTPLGWLRVVVHDHTGAQDVTFLRGVPVQVESIREAEPFGWQSASIVFPQISPFEDPSTGDAALIQDGRNVDVHLVDLDGTVVETLFEGFIVEREAAVEERGTVGVTVTALGALYQADLVLASPRLVVNSDDIAQRLYGRLNGVPGRRYQYVPRDAVVTGVKNRDNASWQPLLTGYLQDILSQATTADGSNQWTLTCAPGRRPVVRLKDRTTVHHTVTLGTPGVSVTLHRDVTQATTTLYGQGVDDGKRSYANLKLPFADDIGPDGNYLAQAWYAPMAGLAAVEPWLYDPDGEHLYNPDGTWKANPAFDPTRVRVERWRAFADGSSKSEALAVAAAEVARDSAPDWTGTVTLRVDPEATTRWQIHAGHNLLVRGWQGSDILLHIAQVSRAMNGTVTLSVDTKARDLLTLDAIEERNRDAVNPARRKGNPRRVSELQSSRPVIDSELAGTLTNVACPAGAWKVVRVPLGTAGTIVGIDVTTDDPTPFVVALFEGSANPLYKNTTRFAQRLTDVVGDPTLLRPEPAPANRQPFGGDETTQDALAELGWLDTLGGPGQRAGYFPGAEDQDDPVTGRHVDEGLSLHFESASDLWAYVAIWCVNAATVDMTISLAPQR